MDLDVVPASDDEDLLAMPPMAQPRPVAATLGQETISSFSVIPAVPTNTTKDSISSSSSGPPARPRPKPAYKGTAAALARPAPVVDTSIIDSFSDMPSSLSDRVKRRQRDAKSSILDVASTSSLRKSSEIIDLASESDDELAAPLPVRKPKVKLIVKTPKTGSESSSTQSFRPVIPPAHPHSSLPPSDPFPISTGTTGFRAEPQGDSEDLEPPITTLYVPRSPAPPLEDESRPDPADAPPPKPPKKSRKKKVPEDGEQPAKKPRAKKAKKDADGSEGDVGEKPKKKRKTKEKETFTSAEFILGDTDSELTPPPPDDIPLPSVMDVALPEGNPGPSRNKSISLSSVADSQGEEELLPVAGQKRKQPEENKDDDDLTSSMRTKTQGKAAGEKKTKKAKIAPSADQTNKKGTVKKAKANVVVTDEEEDGGEKDAMAVDPPEPPSQTVPPADPEPPVVEDPPQSTSKFSKKKAKKAIVSDAEEEPEEAEDDAFNAKPAAKKKTKRVVSDSEEEPEEGDDASKHKPDENSQPGPSSQSHVENTHLKGRSTASASPQKTITSLTAQYTVASRRKSTPLSELIKKVNSRPDSPFPVVVARRASTSAASSSSALLPTTPTTTYSPYAKFSRSALSRIAPLHPNRRTPPPPLPPPPPKPKTKKQKEQEERWEEEMIESVGGWDQWQLLSDEDQKAARRFKWAQEQEGWDD